MVSTSPDRSLERSVSLKDDPNNKGLVQNSYSVADYSDTKQNLDELPDDFTMWTEEMWKDTEACELCNKKFGVFTSRHHWYFLVLINLKVECVENVRVMNARRACED